MATAEELRRAREETAFGGLASGLFEYMRERDQMLQEQGRRPVLGGLLSKEPVMGTDTLRYEGVMPLIAGLLEPIVRGVDAPRAASQGLIPQEDMIGEAYGTAGTAMLGGGAVAKPAGSLGANTLRVYHGGDYKKGDAIEAPFFVTPNKEGAQWFADENDGTVTQYSADIKNPFIVGSKQDNDNLFDLLKRNDIDPEELEDLISDNSPYDGSNILDAAYVPEVRAALQREGYDALYNPSDVLENTNIPAYAVIDPKVLSANASKSAGVLSVVNKYPEIDIDIYGSADRGYELGKIKVPEGSQGSGVGTQVMNELISAADAEGARISLTPDTSFGGSSVSRLKDFYKRFGFVENKGRNKDFSTRNTMYRDPLMSNASKPLGLLVLEQQARGNKQLGGLLQSQGMDINDLSTADPREIQGLLDIAARRGILDKRSAAGLKRGLLE